MTIIVSYRREDTKWITGRIVDRLEHSYGKDKVFMDIDAIPLGTDFRDHLRNVLERCDVLLAIIGPRWLATDDKGRSRIENPADWVRIEIETALAKKIPVIPVLIDRARMPEPAELPESLRDFAYRQAADLDTGRDFHAHMDRLCRAITDSMTRANVRPAPPEPAAAEIAPPPAPPKPAETPAKESKESPQSPAAAPKAADAPAAKSPEPPPSRPPPSAEDVEAAIKKIAKKEPSQPGDAGIKELFKRSPPPSPPKRPDLPTKQPAAPPVKPPASAAKGADAARKPAAQEAASPKGLPLIAWLAVAAGLVGVMVWFSTRETPAPSPDVATETPPARPPKGTDRIEPAVAQRVVLFEEEAGKSDGLRFVGSNIWRTEMVSPGPGKPPELAIRAAIEVPDRKLAITWSLRHNTDASLPASHTIEIMFKGPSDFPFGGISNVPGMMMKQTEQARGVPLAGQSVKVTTNYFLIGLSGVEAELQRNLQLLKERPWFDLPFVYNNGRRAILAFEKGTPGDRAFKEAFAKWGQ